MRKISLILVSLTFFFVQQAFADMDMGSSDGKDCGSIAQACLSAGYARDANAGKKFWQDCMKPLVLGKKVDGVNIDVATVKACRKAKIAQLKSDLNDMQSAK